MSDNPETEPRAGCQQRECSHADNHDCPGYAFTGTCDAGDCDRMTMAMIWTSDGWLPVCRSHAIQAFTQKA